MIPFDTWEMQSMRENIFSIKKFDTQMALNYEKTVFDLFRRRLGRENQNSKMIALPYQYSS